MGTPRYFITKKWNFDPRSTRRARKAIGHLSNAQERLVATGADSSHGCPWIDLTPATVAAIRILNRAGEQVNIADTDAQHAAEVSSYAARHGAVARKQVIA